jgi:hypothetical protein
LSTTSASIANATPATAHPAFLPAIPLPPSPPPTSHRGRQRRADAPAQRVRRRERRALARAIGALLEMALDFERRLESQLAVSIGVD